MNDSLKQKILYLEEKGLDWFDISWVLNVPYYTIRDTAENEEEQ